jgi:dolichyl-phosphate beta-glucosyltransferase
MRATTSEIVFFMDADLSVPLNFVSVFLNTMIKNPSIDILIADRSHDLTTIIRRQNVLREAMGKAFNLLVRLLIGVEFRDTKCGFKAFRRRTIQNVFSEARLDGFAFDVEILWLAKRYGFVVKAMPVYWTNDVESKVRIIRSSCEMLLELLELKLRIMRSNRQSEYHP